MLSSDSESWRPTCSTEMLRTRATLLNCIRYFFTGRGYLEVETPLLSADVVVDAHLDPFTVKDVDGRTAYLQTSPEAAMKRLLAAGSGSIVQITHSFRAAEQGKNHNSEFTILEWYGVGTTYQEQMLLTQELVQACATAVVTDNVSWWLQDYGATSYQDVFDRAIGIDVSKSSSASSSPSGASERKKMLASTTCP